ncbi:MAG: diaminopimelate epimerase [Actinomycetota bacterium]
MRIAKGHGTENDFVVLFDPAREVDLTPDLVRALCDRRAGLGADGVLRVVLAAADPEGAAMSDRARWFMDYRNADGSVAETCGNGLRVFARYLVDAYLAPVGRWEVATRAGLTGVRLGAVGDVTVEMGRASFPAGPGVTVTAAGRTWSATPVHLPNPHAVAFVDDLAEAGDLGTAPEVRPGGAFPQGVNVEFVARQGPTRLALRVWERGVGETRSCGTGVCAAAAAAARDAGLAGPVTFEVQVPGGRLEVGLAADGALELTGPAVLVADGEVRPGWLADHRRRQG